MSGRLLRRLTAVVTGVALSTGLLTLTTPPAEAATFAVSVTASATTVKVGGKITFSGAVSPKPSSRTLYLQRRYVDSTGWSTVKKFSAARTGRYTVATGFGNDRDRYYRVYKPKTSTRKAGYSNAVRVAVNPVAEPLSGGRNVTIVGSGFTGTTKVTVTPQVPAAHIADGTGALPELLATFSVTDDNTIEVTPPASLGGTNLVRIYTPTKTVVTKLTYARTSRKASTFEKAVLDQVNLRRAKSQTCNGKSMPAVRSVAWDGELSDLALSHARDLAARQDVYKGLDHVTYGLKEFIHRFVAAGFTTGGLGEDLALSPVDSSATQVVAQWMSSKSGHCESVMGKSWVKAGVGVASGDWNGQASIFTNLDLRS